MMTQTSFSDIESAIQEKHYKKKIDVISKFPMLDDEKESIMLGSFSWYYTHTHRKSILRPFAYDFGTFLSTPSELARVYLELKYSKQRATKAQIENFKRIRTAPLYASPVGFQDGAYIDIRAAYWQILQVVGWDVDYYPAHWLAKKEGMEDFPFPDFKLARNCLVTAGLPSEASYWNARTKKIQSVKTYNQRLNLGVWAVVMDVLHCIAWDAIAAGAAYVHTDGFICHRQRVEAVRDAISVWGLESRIKETGRTVVFGVGSYVVGDKSTKNPHITAPYDGLELPSYIAWLRSSFSKLARETEFKWSSHWQEMIKSQLSNVLARSQK